MKILQLSQQFPFPEIDGGKIGIANIYKELAKKGSEVTLLYYNDTIIDQKIKKEAENYGNLIEIKHSIKNTKFRILKSIFDNKPIYLRKHFSNSLFKNVLSQIKNKKFDIIHADHSAMAELAINLKKILNIPIGLRLHNIEWKIWYRYAEELKSGFKYKYIIRQARLLKKFEEELIKQFDVLFPITNIDLEYLKNLDPKLNLVMASAGVDVEKVKPIKIEKNPFELIIATTYRWIHNTNGLIWFIEKVLPILKKEIPQIKLTLIGKDIPDSLRKFQSKNVDAIGFVDSIIPYLSRASIYISPLFVGAGIRIKILEAMAMELPVVSTSIGAEGIPATENDGLLIANNEYEFKEQILKLIKNQNLRIQYGKNARNFIINNFTWDISVSKIYESYKKLLK